MNYKRDAFHIHTALMSTARASSTERQKLDHPDTMSKYAGNEIMSRLCYPTTGESGFDKIHKFYGTRRSVLSAKI